MWRLFLFILVLSVFSSNHSHAQIIDLGNCHPDSLSSAGFDKFGEIIGDAQLVIIGEQDHGVGTGYESFAHIVKYLHEKKGFNVVLHEFCFYSFGEIQTNSANNSAQEYRKAMYWPQAKAKEYDVLLNYIDAQKTSDNPIIMEGFDSRISFRNTFYEYCDSLLSARKNLIQPIDIPGYLSTLDHLLKLEYIDTLTTIIAKEKFLMQSQTIVQKMEQAQFDIRQQQIFRNIIGYAKNAWNFEGYKITEVDRFYNRELQMAANIQWFTETMYPNEKFILYMHNGHAAKNFKALKGSIPDSLILRTKNLGELLQDQYGSNCLHIGTTFHSGTYCKWDYKSKNIPSRSAKSLESELHNKGLKYAFVGFEKEKQYDLFFNDFNSWQAGSVVRGLFGQLFDGMIYIDQGIMPTDMTVKN